MRRPREEPPGVPAYLYPHSLSTEQERLQMLTATLDPFTRFHLELAGLKPGWRCLDAGAGNGSIATWLRDRVGPEGHVYAVDLDTRYLEPLAGPTLTVQQRDITRDDLPGQCDLVFMRLVLTYLPDRMGVLRKLVSALKPGGVLVVEEPDNTPLAVAHPPYWRDFWDGFMGWCAIRDIDFNLGLRIPAMFTELELSDVRASSEYPIFLGREHEMARCTRLALEENRAEIVASGYVTEALIDACIALLDNPSHWIRGGGFVVTRGRRAAEGA